MNNGFAIRIERENEKLKKACKQENCSKMIRIMKFLFRYSCPDHTLIFSCLYVLIKNNYLLEASQFLKQMKIYKEDKDAVSLLKKAFQNQEKYQSLTDEQKEVYEDAVFYGHSYYELEEYETAYDIYEWAYYLTEQPVFIYYIGKMLYKHKNYQDAESYFLDYLKKGDSKVSKAYLYLCLIEKKRRNFELSKQYALLANAADKLYNSDYNFEIEDVAIKRARKK